MSIVAAPALNVSVSTLGPTSTPEDSVVITDRFGTLLGAGSGFVAVGSFPTLSDAEIHELARVSVVRLLDEFQQFGNAGTVSPSFAGVIAHDASWPTRPGDGFVGNNYITVIGNGVDHIQNSTEVLIHKDAQGAFFLDNPFEPDRVELDEAEPDELVVGVLGDPVFQADFGAPVRSIRLQPLRPAPEPHAAGLLGLAALTTALLRRSRFS